MAVIWGFSAFRNSFGQPSAYAYYGYSWDNLFGHPWLYAKLSGGSGVQWPCNTEHPEGAERLYTDLVFPTGAD